MNPEEAQKIMAQIVNALSAPLQEAFKQNKKLQAEIELLKYRLKGIERDIGRNNISTEVEIKRPIDVKTWSPLDHRRERFAWPRRIGTSFGKFEEKTIEELPIKRRLQLLENELLPQLVQSSYESDPKLVSKTQYLSATIYLSGNVSAEIELELFSAVKDILNSMDFTVIAHLTPERGSWYKKLFAKSKESLTQPEVQERLRKVEHAVELNKIGTPQAEITKTTAESLSIIISSLSDYKEGLVRIGSLVVAKTTDELGNEKLLTRTLSANELISIESNPGVMSELHQIFASLPVKTNYLDYKSES